MFTMTMKPFARHVWLGETYLNISFASKFSILSGITYSISVSRRVLAIYSICTFCLRRNRCWNVINFEKYKIRTIFISINKWTICLICSTTISVRYWLGRMKSQVKSTFQEFMYRLCMDINTDLSYVLDQHFKNKNVLSLNWKWNFNRSQNWRL